MKRLLTCAVSAFAACLLLATAAQARENYFIVDGLAGKPTRNSFFPDVFAHYSNTLPKSVWIGATHSWKGYSYYGGPGKVSAKGVEARIGTGGKYGRAKVTFRKAGYREEYRWNGGPCGGKKIVIELISVRGRVRLKGETGFTSYDLRSNKNPKKRPWYGTRLAFPSDERCGLEALFGGGNSTIEDGVVELVATNDSAGVEFAAIRDTRYFGSVPELGVRGVRGVDGALVQSGIAALNPPGRFRFGPELEWATVNPLLGSISGDATFTRIDDSTHDWSGDLAVRLAGWPEVPMTGPGIEATLAPYEGPWWSGDEEGSSTGMIAKGTPLRVALDRKVAKLVRKAKRADVPEPVDAAKQSKKYAYDTPYFYDFGPNARVGVSAGRTDGKAWVRMTIHKANGHVSYRVKGKMNRKRIKANFGSFGKVNLRFKREGSFNSFGEFDMDGCRHVGQVIYGTLHGRLVYRGEGSIKKLDTRKYRRFAVQFDRDFPAQPCRDQRTRDLLDPGALHVTGTNSEGGGDGSITLDAYQPGYFSDSSRVDVTANQKIGKVAVSRYAYAYHWMRGTDRMLAADNAADTAVLTARGSLRGAAEFARTDTDGGTWTGNLRIALPGSNMTALAGPDWRVNVYYPIRQGSGP